MIRDLFAHVRLPKGKNHTGNSTRRRLNGKGTFPLKHALQFLIPRRPNMRLVCGSFCVLRHYADQLVGRI